MYTQISKPKKHIEAHCMDMNLFGFMFNSTIKLTVLCSSIPCLVTFTIKTLNRNFMLSAWVDGCLGIHFPQSRGRNNLVTWRNIQIILLEILDLVLWLSLCLTSVWQLFADPQGCEVFLVLRGALGCSTHSLNVSSCLYLSYTRQTIPWEMKKFFSNH